MGARFLIVDLIVVGSGGSGWKEDVQVFISFSFAASPPREVGGQSRSGQLPGGCCGAKVDGRSSRSTAVW